MHSSIYQVLDQLKASGDERALRLFSLEIPSDQLWLDNIVLGLHLAFLVVYILVQLWRWYTSDVTDSASRSHQKIRKKPGILWIVAVSCCGFLLSLNLGVLIFTTYNDCSWQRLLPQVLSAIALTTMWKELLLIRRQGRQTLSPILRVWWITLFPLVALRVSKNIIAYTGNSNILWTSWVDIASFPACLVLFSAGLVGTSGVQAEEENGLLDPLICNHDQTTSPRLEENVSQYGKVGFIGCVTFSWLNPLLATGARKPLELRDIPLQPKEYRAGPTHSRLKSTWDRFQGENPGEVPSLVKVLLVTFWKQVLYTGMLNALMAPMAFVGPVLLEYFVEYMGGETHFPYEGYVLPLCLICAKVVESVATRQVYVESQSWGLQTQMALSAHVYEKGLKLSSLSKQSHTSGEIANYMTVDVQRIGDLPIYVHDLWVVPLQTVLALAVLYKVVGLATLAALATTLILAAANAPLGQMQKKIQDRVMAAKDERMKATSESLRNMRALKLQAWDVRYMEKLENLRKIEFGWLQLDQYLEGALTFIFYTVPTYVAVATFGTCILTGIPLTAGRVFSAVATFRTLQIPLIMVPELISILAMTTVSINRLQGFFGEKEIDMDAVQHVPKQDTKMAVEIVVGAFSWDESLEKPALIGINLQVQKGQRVAVCGTVGSGKSSLLSCILGEMRKRSGSVMVSGRTAYVAQSAWIQSGKIVDNILFGSTMNMAKYVRVLEACALREDLDSLPFGDQTEIGERGINLSGGQKQRIQIARALYNEADIYLLDDPFSAVDAHTGSTLFKECILGAMATKTVIYVTHQMDFLLAADMVLVIRDGEIVQAGKYEELLQVGTDFGSLVTAHNTAVASMVGFDSCLDSNPEKDLQIQTRHITNVTNGGAQEEENSVSGKNTGLIRPKEDVLGNIDEVNMAQLVQEEERERGQVTSEVYWVYLTSYLHGATIPLILLTQALFQVSSIMSNWWMGWATPATDSQEMKTSTRKLIVVFSALSLTGALFIAARAFLMAITGLGISQQFFLRMLHSVFRAPMSFFDSTPTGRILSRASSDQSCLDKDLPLRMTGVATQTINLIGTIVVLCLVTREVLIVFLPVLLLSVWMQRYYFASARELSRLAGILKSPILHHYAESVAGAVTVRGFGQEPRFIKANLEALDQHSRPFFNQFVAAEWLSLRFELLSNAVFGFLMVLLLSLPRGAIDPTQKASVLHLRFNTLVDQDLRSNLDPLGEHSDAKIWETLAKCHLADAVLAKEGKLDAAVHENGENWSMGQRQLISLGRALLKSTRILVLDEATASVDSATDNLIQKTIREEFCHCTVLTVAHRIPTVIDSDEVLVLHRGRIAEYDRPEKLLANSSSMFAKLVSEYSQRSHSTSDLRALAQVESENTFA